MNTVSVGEERLIKILEIFSEHVPCHNCPCNNTNICKGSGVINGNYCDDGIMEYLKEGVENYEL